MRKRAVKNSLFRVVNELDEKMYPLGLKEEVKYIEDLNTVLNRKYSLSMLKSKYFDHFFCLC